MTSGRVERQGRLQSSSCPSSAKEKATLKALGSKQGLGLSAPSWLLGQVQSLPEALAAHVWKGLMRGGGVSTPLVNATLVDPASSVDLGLSPGSGFRCP